jgi:hypothetical protein
VLNEQPIDENEISENKIDKNEINLRPVRLGCLIAFGLCLCSSRKSRQLAPGLRSFFSIAE